MQNKGKYYITTAIAYTSGKPHIGNSYEIVLADSIARYKRADGYDVHFQTGSDEHGQKIEDRAGKAVCKAAVQRELGLNEEPDDPLAIMVGRLTDQKGLDLLAETIPGLLEHVQLAVLGTGDPTYEEMLIGYALSSGGRMSVQTRFDDGLAHRMYAGADLLLMPSLFEPCGLSQMIAMRYGTLPVVRETGGLRDSVLPYEQHFEAADGFAFPDFSPSELYDTVMRAAALYSDEPLMFAKLSANAMARDFSWKNAAHSYAALYASLHPEVTPWKKAEKKPDSEKKPKAAKKTEKKSAKKAPARRGAKKAEQETV